MWLLGMMLTDTSAQPKPTRYCILDGIFIALESDCWWEQHSNSCTLSFLIQDQRSDKFDYFTDHFDGSN